jgi:hypothetical protein
VLRLGFTFVLTTECCHLGMRCDAIFAGVYLPMPNLPSLVKVWEEYAVVLVAEDHPMHVMHA